MPKLAIKSPRQLTVLGCVAAALLAATGCGSATGNAGQAQAVGTQGGPAKVAYIDGSCGNAWRVTVRADLEKAAKEYENIKEVKYVCANGDLNQAISGIQSTVAQGYNPVILFSDFGPALLPAIRSAHQKGTVVVPWLVDVGGKAGEDYTALPVDNRVEIGTHIADYFIEKLNGKGNVLTIGGPAGNEYDVAVTNAIQARLKEKAPEMVYLETAYADWDPGKSAQTASTLISKYPKIDAIWEGESAAVAPIIGQFQAAGRPLPTVFSGDQNGLMKLYKTLKPSNPTFEYGWSTNRTYGVNNALQLAMEAFSGQPLSEEAKLLPNSVADCATDCDALFKPDMPDTYIPTSKVPAAELAALLKK